MTRRRLAWAGAGAVATLAVLERTLTVGDAAAPVIVPVHRIMDSRAKLTGEQLHSFGRNIWPEAVRDLQHCGIRLQVSDGTGQIRRSPGDRPIFDGLQRGVINLVVTARIPLRWDKGRGLAGVSAVYEGYQLCLIALDYAHGHQIPFVSVNTCMHELLHVLLQDVFVPRATWFETARHEWRVDWWATLAWILHADGGVRESAQNYVARLRAEIGRNSGAAGSGRSASPHDLRSTAIALCAH